MAAFVYVLGAMGARGSITYVGWTTDLERRLAQHNDGSGAKMTRGRTWALLYAERLETPSDALKREWRLKRDKAFRALLRDALNGPPRSSRARSAAR